MIRRTIFILTSALAAVLPFGGSAQAASPAWQVLVRTSPTNFPSDYVNDKVDLPAYEIIVTNIGGADSSAPISLEDNLPAGVTVHGSGAQVYNDSDLTNGAVLHSGQTSITHLSVDVGPLAEGTTLTNHVTVSGGGSGAAPVQVSTETTVSAAIPSFDFLPGTTGAAGTVTDPDGNAAHQAGARPHQFNFNFALPSWQFGSLGGGRGVQKAVDGGLRNQITTLPKGMVVNPLATSVRCTEVQFETISCPDTSVVGQVDVYTNLTGSGGLDDAMAPLFNMMPMPGEAAQFAFAPAVSGIYVHVSGGIRAGDYSQQAVAADNVSLFFAQVYAVSAHLWGDPSSPVHDSVRGEKCIFSTYPSCPVPPRNVPFLTAPTSCRDSQTLELAADSWGHTGDFKRRNFPLTDSSENQVPLTGCNALHFNPSLSARPTTNVADSPSGLAADLEIPQSEDLNTLATPHLKKAVVTLPPGLVLNPSSANGLQSCGPSQVGIDPDTGIPDGDPVSCPEASRIGTVEVETSLLDHPAIGSVYIATPHDNPFDSLLAIYVVIDDPVSGVLVKLAGHVAADPDTGRLTTTFDQNPELPFDHFKLQFKSGPHGVLRTPATCGEYSTTSELTPWSAPESGSPATPRDDYAISQGPGGGCASSEASLPNNPSFDSGAASPLAASNTAFVLHLRRNDATQNFSALNVSPPPGLTAKLAGTDACPDSALATAAQKSGRQEQQSPSCPASSAVGSFSAAAGAGPSPYYAPGKVYLSGPYKGAPLSLAFIAPAVAGPYDLGTVVTKAAVHIDPSTGRVSTVSDPLPTILQGIPLDIRSVDVSLNRPDFTRNGTSCDPLSVDGSLTSTLGQVAPLSERFQLAECTRLSFKPKLGIRLFGGTKRGAHPALKGTLTMPAGGANIAKASVALPHSEFLDQAHIGTVCTRVQFAQGNGNGSACPAASIYGQATATSPLVDYALQGSVYLRSSTHELPDLVAALHGPPSQPIAVDVVGRVDSIHGGIRTTFEGVPDLPVSKFVLSMAGAKKGLLQNSTAICAGSYRATALFDGQNGDTADLTPVLKNGKCAKAKHKKGHGREHKRNHRRAALRHLRLDG
jgi:hypothetical protein